jgi:endonuclease-8
MEGPEVRRKAGKLRELLVGEPLTGVRFVFERLQPWEARLEGRRITAIDTYGKAFVLRLEGGLNLYVHPKMFGHWILRVRPGLPKSDRALRLTLRNRKGAAFLYSTNDMGVFTDEELARHKYLTRLGPDILDPSVTEAQVLARYEDPRFADKRLTTLLLDQAFRAGIGNYMRSEILFEARLYPLRRACDLTPEERQRLAHATLAVSRRAFEARGMTVAPEIVAEGKRLKLRPWDYRHWVFKREGKPCYACGTVVERHETEGRRYFMCPTCQAPSLRVTTYNPAFSDATLPNPAKSSPP